MNITRDRLHTIGWGSALAFCFTLTLALTFRVNAVKSQVYLADRQIVQLQQEKMLLETEFETRANQQQLKALNDVDFGYEAPTASQYLSNERQLAALGKPAGPNAPPPILFASTTEDKDASFARARETGVAGARFMNAVALTGPTGTVRKPAKGDHAAPGHTGWPRADKRQMSRTDLINMRRE